MAPAKLNVKSASELADAAICLLPGTTTLQNLEDYFRPKNIKYESVVFENSDEWRNAFFTGRCDAITTDRSDLASVRAIASDPDAIRDPARNDLQGAPRSDHPPERSELARYRELVGLRSHRRRGERHHPGQCGRAFLKSEDPEIQRMLGVNGDFGKMLGLDNKWAYNIVKIARETTPRSSIAISARRRGSA